MILLQPNPENISFYIETAKHYEMGLESMDFSLPLLLEDAEKLGTLAEIYKNAPLVSCHGVFADLNYSGSDPLVYDATVSRVRQCIETALKFRIHKFVFHSCFHPILRPDDPLYRIWNKKAAGLFCGLAEHYGIDIYIENVLDKTPDILVGMMKEANHPNLHVCLDVGHANLSDCTLAQWMEAIHPYVRYFHLSDNRGRWDDHMALGEGTVDWCSLRELLMKYKIRADFTVEVNGIQNVKTSIEFLQQNFPEL